MNKSDYDKAIEDFSQALRFFDSHDTAHLTTGYYNRSMAWEKKGDYDKAIADMTEVIRLNPKLADAYDRRAELLDLKHEPAKAAGDYVQALRLKRNGQKNLQGIKEPANEGPRRASPTRF